MTARILLLLMLATTVARSTDVTLVLDGVNGKAPFRLGSVYPGIRTGSFYRPELLRYYISKITIHHDGSKHTPLPDTYILVDAKEVQRYSLGDLDVGSVDSITFFIGIDKERNHLDPTTYPEWHPLALKTPSMHWGWAAGYRFVTYEGMAGTSETKLTAGFQIHTLDDALYTRVASAATSTRTAVGIDVTVRADYGRLLDAIDVSKGLVMHGSTDEAITLMRNMGSAVYSPGITTSVAADDERTPSLAPNPATDVVLLPTDVVDVRISDMSSATVLSASITAGSPLLSVSTLPNGTYSVTLRHADGSIRHELLVVVR